MLDIKHVVRLVLASVFLAAASATFAANPDVNADENDVAIKGYDPVAYFTEQAPKQGSDKYTASHGNAIYHFSSAKNRDLFKNDPEKYAPQYGGYCAMGVALEKKFDTDPEAWKVVDGKLYLNLNKAVQKKWSKDVTGNLKTANANWNEIRYSTSEYLANK